MVPAVPANMPWMDSTLAPDTRADLAERQMTPEEKLQMVLGLNGANANSPPSNFSPENYPAIVKGAAGYVPGIPRLKMPALIETDAGLGIANTGPLRPGDEATAFPSGLSNAATWNPEISFAVGAAIGSEARARGFNIVLDGALNLARDPRGGRTFEYAGEDPLLAGTMAGEETWGIQNNGIIATVKHFALNDQESGRTRLSANIDEASARESDLLAFEIAVEHGNPGAVMCAYERVNGTYACENGFLLNDVLKRDWQYPGWVLSDWGAVHNTVAAANAGLGQESASNFDSIQFFGNPLQQALQDHTVSAERLDDMVRRILRTMFAKGVVDNPAIKDNSGIPSNIPVARLASEEGIVLLKNKGGILPLGENLRRIAVIGRHIDVGTLSGGGSSQVIPIGQKSSDETRAMPAGKHVFDPPSPLSAIQGRFSHATILHDDGRNVSHARQIARSADIAIVFATQWMTEGADVPNLSLPGKQDELIAAVAAANPNTIVVLETGGPILMPWLNSVAGVIEAWYAGSGGSAALTGILSGDMNPSGRLPITFPRSEAQLPRPIVPGLDRASQMFDVDYFEGSNVGYRWFESRDLTPLFPFGFGLSYTKFSIAELQIQGGDTIVASVNVSNEGDREGAEAVQVYVTPPAERGRAVARLVGWSKIDLKPGETRHISIAADPRLLASFNKEANAWNIMAGNYTVAVGDSSMQASATGQIMLQSRSIAP